jgi:hypothetical protein
MQNVFQSCPVWRDQAGEFITKCINYAILLSAFYKHVNEITYIGNPVKSVYAVFQRSFTELPIPEKSGPEITDRQKKSLLSFHH